MQDKAGNHKYDRHDVAEVFTDFYWELYTSTSKTHEHEHEEKYEQHQDTMKPFTMQELNDAINELKRGKTRKWKSENHRIKLAEHDPDTRPH